MKLNKKILSISIFFILTFLFCLPVLAAPVDDLKDSLIKIGIPEAQTGNVIEYLQEVNVSSEQYQAVLNKIDETAALIKNTKDITSLDISTEAQVEKNMAEAFSNIGLTATFNTGSDGNVTLNVKDASGIKILTMDSMGANNFLTNFDVNQLKNVASTAEQFSENKDNNYEPTTGTEMKQTATSYWMYMSFGAVLVLCSGIWLMIIKVYRKPAKC